MDARTENNWTAKGPLVKNSKGILVDEKSTPNGKQYAVAQIDTGYTQNGKKVSNVIQFETWDADTIKLLQAAQENEWLEVTQAYFKIGSYLDRETKQPRISRKVVVKSAKKV